MAGLKALAKETAIYGMSSIIGRFLNYLLVPIYTNALPVESGGYGIITNMYAITALLMVLLTYGMETGFFRFANKGVDDPMRVYSTTLLSVGATALLFLIVCLSFLHPIAGFLGYGEHPWYMGMMLIVVAMDAFQAIPFAYLRYKKRPVKFAALKLLFIFASIALNIAYFVGMKGENVGVAFAINLACTSLVMLCMWKELVGFRYVLDRELLRRMLHYSFPILILGIAGILNQVADKIIFPFVYPDKAEATIQLGIYGAAMMLMLAYTHTESKEVSGLPGSDPISTWQGLNTIDGSNYVDAQRSQYVVPDKVIASVGYYIPFRHKGLLRGTHLNLFYSGYSSGGYSFCYTNDMNGDGINNDLMYIPKDDSEINFKTEEDRVAFWKFVEQDSYLKNHKGQYAEAYAARAPWVHRFDFRLLEDFEFKIGKTKHCFQLSFDIMNVGNLINSKWGISKTNTVSNSNRILKYEGVKSVTDLTPVFSMYKVNGEYPTKTYDTYQNYSECWKLQVGIRYVFN